MVTLKWNPVTHIQFLLLDSHKHFPNDVVTREIKLFQNYFSLRRHPTEIIIFQRVKTCLKLFQNYFRILLQLMSIFSNMFIVAEIILK